MTVARKALLIAAVVLVMLGAGTLWTIGTESGTRWLLARAAGFLPEELRLGDARGSLLRGVSIESVEWHGEPVRMQVGALFIEFRLLPLLGRHVAIDELDVERIELTIVGGGESNSQADLPDVELPVDLSVASSSLRQIRIQSGETQRSVDELSMVGELLGNDLHVSQLGLRSTWLDLDISGNLQLGDSYAGSVDAGWRWKESAAGALAGQLRLAGDMKKYTLHHSLTAPLAITTSGDVSYRSGTIDVDLLNEWQSLEWSLDEQTLYSSRGALRLRGQTEALALELDAHARLDDQPEARIALRGDADTEAMRVAYFEAEHPFGRILAKGDVRWLPDLSFDLEYTLSDLDPSQLAEPVAGRLGAEGRVTGVIEDDGADIDLRVRQINGEINDNPVRGSGAIRIAGAELTLSDTYIEVGSNSARVEGGFGELLSIGGEVDVANISEVIPDAAGAIRGRFSLRGRRDRPDVEGNVTGTALAWREFSLDSLSGSASFSADEKGSAELRLSGLAVGDLALDEAQLYASGHLAAHEFRASLRGLDSELVVDAKGGYDQQTWSGELASLAVSNDALDRWSTREPSQLIASPRRLSLSPTCLFGKDDKANVCVGGNLVVDGPASFDVAVSALPISAMPLSLPEGVTLNGYVDASISGNWEDDRLTAQAGIELRDAAIDAVYEEERLSLPVSKAVAKATVIENRLESSVQVELADGTAAGNVEFSVQDFLDTSSPVAGRADVSISDALFLAAMVPGIVNPRGNIDGALTVQGNLGSPEFLGEIALADGAFGVRQTGIEVSDLELRLMQMAAGQLRLTGGARSGDGHIAIAGQTQIGTATGIRTELQISGENFELARLPDWQFAASPSITVVFDERVTRVVGDLTIPRANIRVRDIPESAETASPDTVVHRQEETQPAPTRRIDIDVATILGDDVQLSGFGLTTGLEGAVQIKGGTDEVYTGTGRLNLRGGLYKAYGQELEIERGELIFSGPLDNPRLVVRAIRQIEDVVAGIELTGTPTQLESSVFSEPAMSDAEVLSYLLTGRPLATAMSGGEGDTLNNAAFALGLSGAGAITSQIRTELGLDTLTIAGGADDSRLIAGKRIGNRLLVEYGYGLIDDLGTLLLRYQLSDRFTIESRTGTVSNLDILYSVKKQ